MGDWRRLVIFVLACAGIVASLLLPWWVSDPGTIRLEITLRELSVCALDDCRSLPARGAYGVVGIAAFVYGWLAVIGLVLGGIVPALTGQPTKGTAYAAAMIFLMFAGMAYATLEVPTGPAFMFELHPHWPLWAGLGGASLALIGPLALALLDRKPSGPPVVLPPVGEAALPSARVISPLPAAESVVTGSPLVHRSGLPFAVATAEVGDRGLLAICEDGATRELRWEDVGGVLARELRGRPPLEPTLLIDLVARGGRPLRFVITSRLSFAGDETAEPRAALHRLLTLSRAMNPRVELEPATAAFLEHRAALPAWTIEQLERYDARYPAA